MTRPGQIRWGWRSWSGWIVAATLAAGGCGGKTIDPGMSQHEASSASRVGPGDEMTIKGIMQFSQPREYFEGVGLRAGAQGNTVTISVHNLREQALTIVPMQFGVIVGGKLTRVERGKADYKLFPPVRLEPQSTAVGVIVFPEFEKLAGHSLVMNSPEVGKPFRVQIEGGP